MQRRPRQSVGDIHDDLGEAPPSRDTFVGYHRDLRRVMRLRAILDLVFERIGGVVERAARRTERK